MDQLRQGYQLGVQQREGNIEIDWKGGDVQIYADANHILNVFINLLDNANKYSNEAPPITIQFISKLKNCGGYKRQEHWNE
ncbi:MAG: hypothetical protein IPK10_18630 [Bacteroidetes bacterium]|nr:hypothetical protein [Bacteroidota bacterium]